MHGGHFNITCWAILRRNSRENVPPFVPQAYQSQKWRGGGGLGRPQLSISEPCSCCGRVPSYKTPRLQKLWAVQANSDTVLAHPRLRALLEQHDGEEMEEGDERNQGDRGLPTEDQDHFEQGPFLLIATRFLNPGLLFTCCSFMHVWICGQLERRKPSSVRRCVCLFVCLVVCLVVCLFD